MQGGQTYKLGDIADFINGGAWNQSEYSDSGIPVVRVSDIHNFTADLSDCKYLPFSSHEKYVKHELREGDLVICTVGSHPTQPNSVVGRPGIMPKCCDGALLNQNAVCIRPSDEKIDKQWLGYFARSQTMKDYIIAHARGSASQVRVAIGALKDMEVSLPPLEIQQEVARVLLDYDNLIENNNRRIAILEEMAQSLYREWFVTFRFPGHENTEFIDSPLGKIPEGWEVKQLNEVVNIDRGRSYRSKELVEEGGYPFLNLKNVAREGGFRRDGLKRYDGSFKPHQLAKPNDIIMAVTDMTQERAIIARPARVPNMGIEEFVISMDLVKITVKTGYEESFVYSLLCYSDFPHVVKQYANGANVLHLSPKVIETYEALIPSDSIRAHFAEAIQPIHTIQDKLERKNDNLKRQRDMLLPKLISGKIGV